jgi:hypothetical protein
VFSSAVNYFLPFSSFIELTIQIKCLLTVKINFLQKEKISNSLFHNFQLSFSTPLPQARSSSQAAMTYRATSVLLKTRGMALLKPVTEHPHPVTGLQLRAPLTTQNPAMGAAVAKASTLNRSKFRCQTLTCRIHLISRPVS